MTKSQEEQDTFKLEAERLNELYKAKKQRESKNGVTFGQKDIAAISGQTQPAISAYLRGITPLRIQSAELFAEALDCHVEDFSPRLADAIRMRDLLESSKASRKAISHVPVLQSSDIQEVMEKLKDENFTMSKLSHPSILPIAHPVSSRTFAIELGDSSFSPKMEIGTFLLFNPDLSPNPTDVVYVEHKSKPNQCYIREYKITEYLEDGGHHYELTCPNPAFPTLDQNYQVIGVAELSVRIDKLR